MRPHSLTYRPSLPFTSLSFALLSLRSVHSTRIAKLMDAGGMKMMLATAESAAEIIEKSKPLLKQATMLAQEVTPIIEELNSRDVLGTVQDLTSSASKAVDDINHINKIILTEDNVLLLKEAVGSLVNTLKNIEVSLSTPSDRLGNHARR